MLHRAVERLTVVLVDSRRVSSLVVDLLLAEGVPVGLGPRVGTRLVEVFDRGDGRSAGGKSKGNE